MKLGHIKELDGVRGLAIALVIVWHYIGVPLEGEGLFAAIIRGATRLTYSGVDLFFVLSGFLIGRILMEAKGSTNFFKVFYIKRVFRIFPLYYLLIIGYLLFIATGLDGWVPWLFGESLPMWSYPLFLQNLFMVDHFGPHFLGISWSLAVEEQFYLLLPLTIFLIPRKAVPWIAIIGILAAPVIRYVLPGQLGFVVLFARMDSLLAGVLLAWLYLEKDAWALVKQHSNWLWLPLLGCIAAASLLSLRIISYGPLNPSMLTLLYTSAVALALARPDSGIAGGLRSSWLSYLGKISYGIYIYHQVVAGVVFKLVLDSEPGIGSIPELLTTSLCVAVTLGVASASFYWFEKPILRLGKRYQYKMPDTAANNQS